MHVLVKVVEVGWDVDPDNNRHPRARIECNLWRADVYHDPTEGWNVVTLDVGHRCKLVTWECHTDSTASRRLAELVGGKLVFDALSKLEEDLFEFGCQGASKRWNGKTIKLAVRDNA